MPIAVTGSTGALGGRVARRLADGGVAQRLIVRDASRAPQLEHAEVREVPGGFADHDGMRDALAGAEVLFLVPAAEAIDRIEQHRTAVDAAVAAGVEHLVYLSFVGASPDNTFTLGRHHWATEEHVRGTGLPFTFVRMSLYMDFVPNFAGPDGVIRGPAGDGRMAAVLRDDLADVVAAILSGDLAEHAGQTYDVTGPASFSLAEAAELLGVTYHAETVEEAYASRSQYGAPDWEVEGWVTSYLAIANGELDFVSDTVERFTGSPATSLEEYVASRAR